MKRKFFQFLMMVAVTVTLGVFVSCKDTNEDLIKQLELRLDAIEGNTTLAEAIAKQEANLQKLKDEITALKAQVDGIKSCGCPDNMSQTIQAIKDFMDAMNDANVDPATLASMKDFITTLTNNYQTINNFFTNVGVSQQELNDAVKLLEDKIAAIKKCECDLSKLAEIEKTANDALALAQDAAEKVKTAQATADAANLLADQAKKAAEDALKAAGDAQTAADAANLLAETAKGIADAADKLSKENKEAIDKHTEAISKIELQIVSMSDSLKHAYETADKAFVQASANKASIDSLGAIVKADKEALDNLKDVVIPEMKEDITTLYNKVDSLAKEIDDLKPEITKLYAYADANLEKAKAYTDLEIALLRADLNQTNISIQELQDKLDDEVDDLWEEILKLQQKDVDISEELQAYKDSTDEKINNALSEIVNLQNAVSTINDSLKILDNKIEANTTRIGDLEEKLDSVMDAFQEQIDSLQADIDDLTDRVEKNEEDIQDIFGELDKLRETLAKQVTGIIVQATYNPAFGTVNLPFGVQSNVLLTYYGEANGDVYFPTNRTANYVDESFALTSKDMEMLGIDDTPLFKSGDVIMQNDHHNAGEMFLTVNPNTVDFSHLNLSLVNSQDEESYIKLGQLVRSEKTLQFGVTRADNGFYECAANLDAGDVKKVQKLNFNAGKLKSAVKEIVNKRSAADFAGVATDLADVIKGLKLDANAVKCEWEDGDGQTHAVYSNYNVAATAAKPLSFTTLKDANYQTVPGYERAMSLLDKISEKLHGAVHTVYNELNNSDLVNHVGALTIRNVEIADLTPAQLALFKVEIDTNIVINGLSYHLDMSQTVNVPVKFTKDVTVPVTIDKEVEIDLSNVTVNTPTIVVTTDIKNMDGTATLVVPVKDQYDNVIGNATVDLDQVDVTADASINSGTITLDGVAVAKLNYSDNLNATISVDETFSTTVNIEKWIYFGDYQLDADGNIVYDANSKPVYTDKKTFRIWITRDFSNAAESLWGSAQDALGSVNDMLDDLREIVGDVNDMIDKINSYEAKIDNQIDTYMDRVKSYIDKINSKICGFVNNFNDRLQPTMIASDGSGSKMLSEAKNYPTVLGSTINFIPTTWNIELLVPVAKKHVAVTNVFNGTKSAQGGDATCKSELDRVNGLPTINEVLNGDLRRCVVNGMKSGYVYEIAYSALDFHGKISTRKYYIKIK